MEPVYVKEWPKITRVSVHLDTQETSVNLVILNLFILSNITIYISFIKNMKVQSLYTRHWNGFARFLKM